MTMKKFLIEWETDYCDDFPERSGECVIEAETEDEAAQKFWKNAASKQIITGIYEEGKQTE